MVVLDEQAGVVYAPDLFFITREHVIRVRDGVVYGPPDLVVEILSPTTSERDLGDKARNYFRYGVPWYWIVDPESRTIQEHEQGRERYDLIAVAREGETFRPRLFPGMEVRLSDFQPLPVVSEDGPSAG